MSQLNRLTFFNVYRVRTCLREQRLACRMECRRRKWLACYSAVARSCVDLFCFGFTTRTLAGHRRDEGNKYVGVSVSMPCSGPRNYKFGTTGPGGVFQLPFVVRLSADLFGCLALESRAWGLYIMHSGCYTNSFRLRVVLLLSGHSRTPLSDLILA